MECGYMHRIADILSRLPFLFFPPSLSLASKPTNVHLFARDYFASLRPEPLGLESEAPPPVEQENEQTQEEETMQEDDQTEEQ